MKFRPLFDVAIRTIIAVACVAACIQPTLANTFHVSTSADLRAPLNASSDGGANVGEINTIEINPGVYKTGSQPFHYNSTATTGYLSLVGEGINASFTVLDGNGTTQVLDLLSKTQQIEITNLTVQNGNTS